MVQGYDSWLYQQADNYMSSFCEGEPKVVSAEKEYEPDGYSMSYTYNCEDCDERDCEYWKDFHEKEYEEYLKEKEEENGEQGM